MANKMNFTSFDIETTNKESYGRKANPFDKDNRIVCLGHKLNFDSNVNIVDEYIGLSFIKDLIKEENNIKYLIGCNIKFDLLYLWQDNSLQDWIKNGGQIWDIQLVEYILTAQEHKYASLDQMSLQYGGTQKDNSIKDLFKAGYGSEDIPKDILFKYNAEDVLNTELIFKKQWNKAIEFNMLELIKVHNNFLLATTEMEYNGMYCDKKLAPQIITKLQSQLISLEQFVPEELKGIFNWESNKHVAAYFFGGEIEYNLVISQKLISNGKVRNKYDHKSYTFKPKIMCNKEWLTPTGNQAVNEKVLKQLSLPESKALLHNRGITKQINTYLTALPKLVQEDGLIHQSLNHVATATGRLSCNNPNLQNIPRGSDSDIKMIFKSRWGKDGCLLEIDAKQLEVNCAAIYYQDEQLILDLLNNLDLHIQTASWALNKVEQDVTKEERTDAKGATFAVFYGASAIKITNLTNLSEQEAQNYIDQFYDKYHEVKSGQDMNIKTVQRGRIPIKSDVGYTGKSYLTAPWGRKWVFFEKDWYKNGRPCFIKPQIKDFPIQGLAGEVLSIVGGELFRILKGVKDCLMINTVHDSLVFDIKKSFLKEGIQMIQNVLYFSHELVEHKLGIKVPIKLGWEYKVGDNWKEMKEYKV